MFQKFNFCQFQKSIMEDFGPGNAVPKFFKKGYLKIRLSDFIQILTQMFTLMITLSVRGRLSKGTLKTTIEVATLELCNFSTQHSHGSTLGSFESQEPQFSFSRPEICRLCVRRIPAGGSAPYNPRATISSSPPGMS